MTIPLLSAALALALAACGDEGSSSSGNPPPADKYTLDNVCEQIPTLLCQARQNCCLQGAGYDETTCIAYEKDQCLKNVADVKAGKMTFDDDSIDPCITALKPYADKCFLYITDYFNVPQDLAACSKVFQGQLTEGTICERGAQCASSLSDRELVTCDEMTKKCTTTRFLPKDAACKVSTDLKEVCDVGTYCNGDPIFMTAGKCVDALPLGAQCGGGAIDLSCGLGAYCDGTTKVCTESKADGAMCSTGPTGALECKSLKCENGTCIKPDPLFDAAECGK